MSDGGLELKHHTGKEAERKATNREGKHLDVSVHHALVVKVGQALEERRKGGEERKHVKKVRNIIERQ